MSDQKAFAKFPTTGGGYQYVDIFTIEAIGQGGTSELATIFAAGSDRYYLVEVAQAELERAGEPDAASWSLALISKVARLANDAVRADEAEYDPTAESDDEDDFTPNAG